MQSEAVRRSAQRVARALGKRWERRLPAGSWAQPTHGRFAASGDFVPGPAGAGAPSTIEVVPIRRNMAQLHRCFVVTAIVPAYPCAGDRLRPSKKRIEKQIQGLGAVGEPQAPQVDAPVAAVPGGIRRGGGHAAPVAESAVEGDRQRVADGDGRRQDPQDRDGHEHALSRFSHHHPRMHRYRGRSEEARRRCLPLPSRG